MWITSKIKCIWIAMQTTRLLERDGYAVLFPHKMKKTIAADEMAAIHAGIEANVKPVIGLPQFVTGDDKKITATSTVMVAFYGTTPEMVWHAFRLFYLDVKLSKNPPDVVAEYWRMGESIRILLMHNHDAVLAALEKPELVG